MHKNSLFLELDPNSLKANLLSLLEQTARCKGRIAITGRDGAQCVMISKDELDSLEKALEILGSTHDGQVMRNAVQQCAQLDTESPRAAS